MLLMWCFHVKSYKPTMFEILSRKKESTLSADTGTSDTVWDEKCHWSHLMSQFGIEMKMSGQFVWHLKVSSVVFDLH